MSDALEKYPEYKLVKIGHYPESTSPKTRIQEALGIVSQLKNDIEDMISVKCICLEFAWKWGEYQKAVAILHGALPATNQRAGLKKSNQHFQRIRAEAREWYMLWFEEYKVERPNKRNSREDFHSWFIPILEQINSGERHIPDKWKAKVIKFLEVMMSYADGQSGLTGHFTNKRFHGVRLLNALDAGKANIKKRPPHREKDYPL